MSQIFFDYELPKELVAQEPSYERDASRLLVVDRNLSNHTALSSIEMIVKLSLIYLYIVNDIMKEIDLQ